MTSLYQRVLGGRFAALCPQVQGLHAIAQEFRASGRSDIQRGAGLAARFLAFMARMPPAGRDVALAFEIRVEDGREHWTRDFGGRRFTSVMWDAGDALFERLGPTRFEYRLEVHDGALRMILQRGWLFGLVPLPRFALPRIETLESCRDGRYHFDVSVSWPGIGLVVAYCGYLETG